MLSVGSVLTLNMGLELGQTTESVEVKAEAIEVSATSASVGNVVEGKRLLDLPLDGRSAYDLDIDAARRRSDQAQTTISTATRAATVNFTMDGVSAMDNLHQTRRSICTAT